MDANFRIKQKLLGGFNKNQMRLRLYLHFYRVAIPETDFWSNKELSRKVICDIYGFPITYGGSQRKTKLANLTLQTGWRAI